MQFLLSQTEYNELKNAKEPDNAVAFSEDFERMLHESQTNIVRSHDFGAAEVLHLQVRLSDIPTPLRQLIERNIRN